MGPNGETIGTFKDEPLTFSGEGGEPRPLSAEPIEFEVELKSEEAEKLWATIERERREAFDRFCQEYRDGKISRHYLERVAEALGFKVEEEGN